MMFSLLPMIVLATVPAEKPAAAAFAIESPSQTSRSVLLAWETDQKVRIVEDSETMESQHAHWADPSGRPRPIRRRLGTAWREDRGQDVGRQSRGRVGFRRWPNSVPGHTSFACSTAPPGRINRAAPGWSSTAIWETREDTRGSSRATSAPTEKWTEISGSFQLPPDVRIARILLYQIGAGTVWFDDVWWSVAGSDANLLADGSFDGQPSFRIFYRKGGQTAWHAVEAVVLERFHNVIFLEPETTYEFKVERVAGAKRTEAESQVLTVATRPCTDRAWQGLRRGADHRTPTPAAVYPCIQSLGGKLYYAESRGGSLWLSELDGSFNAQLDQRVGEAVSRRRPAVLSGTESGGRPGRQALCLLEAGLSWRRATRGSAWLPTIRPRGPSASRW